MAAAVSIAPHVGRSHRAPRNDGGDGTPGQTGQYLRVLSLLSLLSLTGGGVRCPVLLHPIVQPGHFPGQSFVPLVPFVPQPYEFPPEFN
jgi:hypothetical protein